MTTSTTVSTTTPGGAPAAVTRAAQPAWRLALLHTKFQILETVRIPIAMIGNLVFPALALLFFVVPQRAVADDPVFATAAVAQLGMFAIMSTSLFTHGVGVAEDRALPFDTFVRALPAGALPRLLGRILTGLWLSALALVPLILVGWIFTKATLPPGRLLASIGVVLIVALPFTLLGLALGYWLSSKAAIAVVQVVLFPLAFAGGLFMPPEIFPPWLNTISLGLPSRAGRDLLVAVTSGQALPASTIPVLAAWTAAFAVMAVLAYRGDEGRRYR